VTRQELFSTIDQILDGHPDFFLFLGHENDSKNQFSLNFIENVIILTRLVDFSTIDQFLDRNIRKNVVGGLE